MNDVDARKITDHPFARPPSYLYEVRDRLRQNEPEIWAWFRSDEQNAANQEAVHLDLLKSTVRIEAEANPELYQTANQAAAALGLDVPVTIYQARQSGRFNASISSDASHAHLVLQGELSERLEADELSAVFGHELSHLLLWRLENGDFLTVAAVLNALSQDPSDTAAPAVYLETQRLFSLYTEIFCDRGAMMAAGDFEPVVSSLIKIVTGVKTVRVRDYLKQADEIFQGDTIDGSTQPTHPELYVRARSLVFWKEKKDDLETEIQRMVQGKLSLDRMDLCRQVQAAGLTNELLNAVLAPEWMRCDGILAHARLYFPDYQPGDWNAEQLVERLTQTDTDFRNYIGYVMLDLVTADRELLEPALAHTIGLARLFGIADSYLDVARKELRLRKKQIQEIENSADELASQAAKKQIRATAPEAEGGEA